AAHASSSWSSVHSGAAAKTSPVAGSTTSKVASAATAAPPIVIDGTVSMSGNRESPFELRERHALGDVLEHDPALLDDDDVVGDAGDHLFDALLDEDDRKTLRLQLAERGEDLLDRERREARRRLVDEQDLRPHRERR